MSPGREKSAPVATATASGVLRAGSAGWAPLPDCRHGAAAALGHGRRVQPAPRARGRHAHRVGVVVGVRGGCRARRRRAPRGGAGAGRARGRAAGRATATTRGCRCASRCSRRSTRHPGRMLGVVTRNRMGCEVLCTDLLFIADVDVPELEDATTRRAGVGPRPDRHRVEHRVGDRVDAEPAGRQGRGRVPAPAAVGRPGAHPDGAGRSAPRRRSADAVPASPRPGETSVAESLACEPVWEFARRHPDLGVRVYRTAAGLRVIVTGAAAPPGSDRARGPAHRAGVGPALRRALRHPRQLPGPADPQAVPGRGAGAGGAAGRSRTTGPRRPYEEWVSEYDGRASGHAVCRLVSASGPEPGPDEQRLVALHDARCRVGERLPLA